MHKSVFILCLQWGSSALMIAVYNCREEAVAELVAAGADKSITNKVNLNDVCCSREDD